MVASDFERSGTGDDINSLGDSMSRSDEGRHETKDVSDDGPTSAQAAGVTRGLHGKLSYPNVLELKDTSGERFYAFEDREIIHWIGRDQFIEVLTTHPDGWVDSQLRAGLHGQEKIFKSSMKHGRMKGICLYAASEYEKLTYEAHTISRKVKPTDEGQQGRRPPFVCIHCRTLQKDKNMLSWHRMTSACPKKPKEEYLKMYPTWGKGEHLELRRIENKIGLWGGSQTKSQQKKRRMEEQVELTAKKVKIVGRPRVKAYERANVQLKSKSPLLDKRPLEHYRKVASCLQQADGVPKTCSATIEPPSQWARSKPKATVGRAVLLPSDSGLKRGQDESPQSGKKTFWVDVGHLHICDKDEAFEESKSAHIPIRRTVLPDSASVGVSGPAQEDPSMTVAPGVLRKQTLKCASRARVSIEAAAHAKAAKLTLEEHGGLRPEPVEVSITGLAILLQETDSVLDRGLLCDPEATMAALNKLYMGGNLLNLLRTAFGTWYCSGTPQEWDPVVVTLVQGAVRAFNANQESPYVAAFNEIRSLGAYLKFKLDSASYVVEKKVAQDKVDTLRKNLVETELHNFDKEETLAEEKCQWGWSPLYKLMDWAAPMGWSPAPWDHTENELQRILAAWQNQDLKDGVKSAEVRCPHIVRALKLLVRRLHGKKRPLGHPLEGLSSAAILEYARSTKDSNQLVHVVDEVFEHGWLYFPTICRSEEPLKHCKADLLALLGPDEEQQRGVLQKINTFLAQLAVRAVLDLQQTGHEGVLAKMWHRTNLTVTEQLSCCQVFSDALTLREDIDTGWVFVGECTPTHPFMPEFGVLNDTIKGLMSYRVGQLHALQSLSMHADIGPREPESASYVIPAAQDALPAAQDVLPAAQDSTLVTQEPTNAPKCGVKASQGSAGSISGLQDCPTSDLFVASQGLLRLQHSEDK